MKNNNWLIMPLVFAKRFLNKISFLLLLIMVPVLAVSMSYLANRESGILRIELCAENPEDPVTMDVIQTLLDNSGMELMEYENLDRAMELLQQGDADAVWLFRDNIREKTENYLKGVLVTEPPVLVYEREETIPLKLVREKLFAAMYKWTAYIKCDVEIDNILKANNKESIVKEHFDALYDYYRSDENIFIIAYPDGKGFESDNYLLAPVRGMLSLLVLLAGLTGLMYFRHDEEKGVYDRFSSTGRVGFRALSVFVAILLVAAVTVSAICLSGVGYGIAKEILLMLTYIPACFSFCMVMGEIWKSLGGITVATTFILLISFILCPVFFKTGILMPIQWMLPATYYLRGIHNSHFLMLGAIYVPACGVIFGILLKIKNHRSFL